MRHRPLEEESCHRRESTHFARHHSRIPGHPQSVVCWAQAAAAEMAQVKASVAVVVMMVMALEVALAEATVVWSQMATE